MFISKDPGPGRVSELYYLLKRKAIRNANSSRLYQLHKKSVIDGNRQPSKKPSRMRVVTSEPNDWTRPVQRHTRPQAKVMAGMTRLNWRRFTKMEEGNSARM